MISSYQTALERLSLLLLEGLHTSAILSLSFIPPQFVRVPRNSWKLEEAFSFLMFPEPTQQTHFVVLPSVWAVLSSHVVARVWAVLSSHAMARVFRVCLAL